MQKYIKGHRQHTYFLCWCLFLCFSSKHDRQGPATILIKDIHYNWRFIRQHLKAQIQTISIIIRHILGCQTCIIKYNPIIYFDIYYVETRDFKSNKHTHRQNDKYLPDFPRCRTDAIISIASEQKRFCFLLSDVNDVYRRASLARVVPRAAPIKKSPSIMYWRKGGRASPFLETLGQKHTYTAHH